jgi:hypothetical protein
MCQTKEIKKTGTPARNKHDRSSYYLRRSGGELTVETELQEA